MKVKVEVEDEDEVGTFDRVGRVIITLILILAYE